MRTIEIATRVLNGFHSRLLVLLHRSTIDKRGSIRLGRGLIIRNFRGIGGGRSLRIVAHGKNWIGAGSIVQGSGTFTMGLNSFLGERCIIGCNEQIDLGRDVLVAQCVTIRDTDHRFDRRDIPIIQQGVKTAPVVIGDDVWLGHGAVILKGVTIGRGAIVAAGAVVNGDVGEYEIVGGVPARKIGSRPLDTRSSQDEAS